MSDKKSRDAAGPAEPLAAREENDPDFEEGTYWREEAGHRFTLLIDHIPRAQVAGPLNVAFIGRDGSFTERLAVPDSSSVFAAVEAHLGVGRIDEFLGTDGRPAAHLRHDAEDRAARFGRKHPPSREPQVFLRRAWSYLERAATKQMLSPEGAQARTLVREALRDFENHGSWTETARNKARLAASTLGLASRGRAEVTLEGAAEIDAGKAVASLEHGRAAEQRVWREQQRAWLLGKTEKEQQDRDLEDRER